MHIQYVLLLSLPLMALGCAQNTKPAEMPSSVARAGFASPPLCDLPGTFTALEDMPESVQRSLSSFLGRPGAAKSMEGRGDFYHSTDVVLGNNDALFRRFIQGTKLGERYIVIYEVGGVGRSVQAVLFQPSANGRMTALTRITTSDQAMCADTDLFLKDPLSPRLDHRIQSP